MGRWIRTGNLQAVEGAGKEYRQWFRSSPRPCLGDVQFVAVEDGITVANVIGQHGIRRKTSGAPPIRYAAVRDGLKKVADWALGRHASVHIPRIGCGLAGGRWEEMEPIVESTLCVRGIEVIVYDFKSARVGALASAKSSLSSGA